jgi:hypothetical protein
MSADILSFDHPYFAVTDEDGRFHFDQGPPGSNTLKAWHESWRIVAYDRDGRPTCEASDVMIREVRLTAGGTTDVDLQLTARE